jgi:hypothetical protein
MSIVKRAGWILFGVLIGGLATNSMSATRAQPSDSRLRVTMAGTPVGMMHFVKDTKSTGCWLVVSREAGLGSRRASRSVSVELMRAGGSPSSDKPKCSRAS